MLPSSTYMALQSDTAELKKQGWSQPPGSKFILYRRPRLQPEIRFKALSVIKGPQLLPTVVRFALTSAVSPRLTEALSVADRIRTALMARSQAAAVFSGRDDYGRPLKTSHQHTHIFCEYHSHRGEITHVTLYAPQGFNQEVLVTVAGLEKVWGHAGHDLQLIYLGCGSPQDFIGGKGLQGINCSMFASSRVWVSSTPFVLTRLPKYNRNRNPGLMTMAFIWAVRNMTCVAFSGLMENRSHLKSSQPHIPCWGTIKLAGWSLSVVERRGKAKKTIWAMDST
jgi:CRISPR-associated protein Csb2